MTDGIRPAAIPGAGAIGPLNIAVPLKIKSCGLLVSLNSTRWPDSVIIRDHHRGPTDDLDPGAQGPAGQLPRNHLVVISSAFGVSRAVIWVSWDRMSLLGHL